MFELIIGRFSKGGYAVALLSRSEDSLKPVQSSISSSGGLRPFFAIKNQGMTKDI
jgi:hypothetical protein